ncbi:thioredoxin domain-containing protein [Streptococcus catagoni]|uniref:thioredoxin domain-containing protein n=1 Tax=Streptococcus catagoni TaxID=2654874 RepID=UPI00140C5170|nr:thioredoxin domain-containing protein [Streptococcus catagoni]
MKEVSLFDINKMMTQKKTFYLYTGRSTCPHCRRFLPKLLKASKKSKRTVFYLNSQHTKSDKPLQIFRQHYKINTVPNLSFFKAGQSLQSLKKGSKASKQDIYFFLKSLQN